MRVYTTTLNAVGISTPFIMSAEISPVNITLETAVLGGSGVFGVQYTLDDGQAYPDVATYNANATWWDHATLGAGSTASGVGNIAFPVKAVRLNVTAATVISIRFRALQAGIRG